MPVPVRTHRGLPLMASCTEYISTCMPENTHRHTQSELCGLKDEPDDSSRMGLTIVELAV